MPQTGKSKTCVWRWQERFMQADYDGLLRDKTRLHHDVVPNVAEAAICTRKIECPLALVHCFFMLAHRC
jgi:hypothetical protein